MDSYTSLFQQKDEIMFQIKQFKLEYETLDKSSIEAIAIATTIAELRIRLATVQNQVFMLPKGRK